MRFYILYIQKMCNGVCTVITICGFCFFQVSLSVDPEESRVGEPVEGTRRESCLGVGGALRVTVRKLSVALVAPERWLPGALLLGRARHSSKQPKAGWMISL